MARFDIKEQLEQYLKDLSPGYTKYADDLWKQEVCSVRQLANVPAEALQRAGVTNELHAYDIHECAKGAVAGASAAVGDAMTVLIQELSQHLGQMTAAATSAVTMAVAQLTAFVEDVAEPVTVSVSSASTWKANRVLSCISIEPSLNPMAFPCCYVRHPPPPLAAGATAASGILAMEWVGNREEDPENMATATQRLTSWLGNDAYVVVDVHAATLGLGGPQPPQPPPPPGNGNHSQPPSERPPDTPGGGSGAADMVTEAPGPSNNNSMAGAPVTSNSALLNAPTDDEQLTSGSSQQCHCSINNTANSSSSADAIDEIPYDYHEATEFNVEVQERLLAAFNGPAQLQDLGLTQDELQAVVTEMDMWGFLKEAGVKLGLALGHGSKQLATSGTSELRPLLAASKDN